MPFNYMPRQNYPIMYVDFLWLEVQVCTWEKKKGVKALQEVRMCSEAALAAEPMGRLYFYVLLGEGQSEDHKCHFLKQLILPLMSS